LRRAGLKAGDRLRVEAAGAGRIVLVRTDDVIARHKGCLTGVYPKGYLHRLRAEWR
jgi:bifunctional DNA-binding transcriptional regulator/antitoxin component of YhaV-PrlF toxin-antitoxin module